MPSGGRIICDEVHIMSAPGNDVSAQAAADVPTLQPRLLSIAPEFNDDEERNNLSGAACNPQGVCLLIGDEKRYARFFAIDGDVLRPAARLFLLTDQETGKKESDGEGIAFAGGAFYVIGSHSRDKKAREAPSRHFIFRYRADLQAAPTADIGSATSVSPLVERASLDAIIAAHPILSQHLGEAPGDTPNSDPNLSEPSHGVNIEGLAVSADRMFVGFRGPVDEGGAIVLGLGVNALFAGAAQQAETYRLNLGAGQGVRDLAAVRGGILVLSGPERRNKVVPNPEFFFWEAGSGPARLVRLGRLDGSGGKDNPESITVLEETDRDYRVLVLWDGDQGGRPMIVRVPKPTG